MSGGASGWEAGGGDGTEEIIETEHEH